MPDSTGNEVEALSDSKDTKFDFGLLANFVHQVINPLNGVSGTLGNLIDGATPPAKQTQRLRAARAQLEHAISLVRNLAYFSQISIDPKNTNPGAIRKTCVMPQTIIEAIQFFQELAYSRNVAVELVNRWDQFKVEGNPDLLRQVFMNLVDNAVKYSDKGSKVEIEMREQKKSGGLIVAVRSKGSHIPIAERKRIFELGYRGESAKKVVASGTGLGLHICQIIIAGVHNGSITVESSTSGETEFLLRFPEFHM